MTERYKNGKIYRLVCNTTGQQYIGSTCIPLRKRMYSHKDGYKRWLDGKHHFISSYEILKGENYDIILIEEYPCDNKEQLHSRERHYIESMECVNKVIPTRTMKEWLEENKDNIKEKSKDYYQTNKDTILEKGKKYKKTNIDKLREQTKEYRQINKDKVSKWSKTYYEKNKDKLLECISCDCGGKYIKSKKARHEKSNKHQKYIENGI